MMYKAALLFAIVGATLADQGYGAYDQQAYARDGAHSAASSGYGAPTGGSAYAAPSASGYDTYGAVVEEEGLDLGINITELLPIFLAVFAAIILAQLLSPLLLQLLALLVGLVPLGINIKAPIVNALLSPFNLVLAEFPAGGDAATGPLTVFPAGRSFGRSMADGFGLDLSADQVDIISSFATKAIDVLSEKFEA